MLVEIAHLIINGLMVIGFLAATILCILAFPRALKETIFGPREFDTVCVLGMCIVVFAGWIGIIGLITG